MACGQSPIGALIATLTTTPARRPATSAAGPAPGVRVLGPDLRARLTSSRRSGSTRRAHELAVMGYLGLWPRRYSGAMSQRRSPKEKKEDSYRHEWRARSRIDQSALRIGRRRRKAGINRANRRLARGELADLPNKGEDLIIPERPPWDRWHVPVRLDRWVESRVEGRRDRAGRRYFKEPYDSERHRRRFAAFLAAVLETCGDEARHLVPIWQDRLEDYFRARPWLECFFQDEPLFRDALDSWIARWGADTSGSPRRDETT